MCVMMGFTDLHPSSFILLTREYRTCETDAPTNADARREAELPGATLRNQFFLINTKA